MRREIVSAAGASGCLSRPYSVLPKVCGAVDVLEGVVSEGQEAKKSCTVQGCNEEESGRKGG